jgi:SIR2-like domain
MRFFADGPNIPEELLENRDNGNVVFFCGAGISRPAGLPGFADLAEQVVDELGAPPDAKVRAMLTRVRQEPDDAPPLDQIFSILQQEYRSANIDDIVSRLLKTSAAASVDQHHVILRLSKSAAHQTQIVTTNFDLLFERAQKNIQRHVAPALPDLSSGQPLTGLVYLHGRLNPRVAQGVGRHQLILSSSDFGRAYLADGWATRFVRDLLKNYVIVLLGYSANDPPVRYLLEGLHARADGNSSKIYAFDQGTKPEVLDRWRNRGVIPLAYPKSDMHSSLWDSLRAWADRADDPEKWRRSILALASNDPKHLSAHERGQVVSLACTTEGAKLFAEASVAPPAEWICAFDKHVRYGDPQDLRNDEEVIDPLAIYGLDDDPPRSKEETGNANSLTAIDALAPSPFDERKKEYSRLAGISAYAEDPISPRLFYISRWFGRVLDQPASIWWAAGYLTLHPGLRDQIEWYLDHSNLVFSATARRLWELLLQKFSRKQLNSQYHAIAKIKRRGWSAQIHYEFEDAIQPFLKSRRPFHIGPIPPKGSCEELGAGQIVNFEVEFPARGSNELELPPEELHRCFRSVRRGLERGATLLKLLETRFWATASFETDSRPGKRHLRDSDRYLHWTKNLFDRLSVQYPLLARADVLLWPNNDGYFFDKLKTHAWMNTSLFSGQEAGEGLLALHEDGFWNSYHRRELLHTLRARWNDMPFEVREKIEQRIIVGQTIDRQPDHDGAQERNARTAASMLGWLQHNGCILSDNTTRRLSEFRSVDSSWDERWESNADQSFDARAGYVAIKADPSKIIDLPISQIIEAAGQHSARPFMEFAEHKPFSGLVKQRPQRALAALAYQARRGNFPLNFWQTALGDWPDGLPERVQWLFAARLARLPTDIISQLPHCAPRWLKTNLPRLAQTNTAQALAIWDSILNALFAGCGKALQSGMGDVFIAGNPLFPCRTIPRHPSPPSRYPSQLRTEMLSRGITSSFNSVSECCQASALCL